MLVIDRMGRLRRGIGVALLSGLVIVGLLLSASAAEAAGHEVDLTYDGGRQALKKEPSEIALAFSFFGKAECTGTDEAATLGSNPAKTVKVTGSGRDLPDLECQNEAGTANGGLSVKSLSLASSGKITAKISFAVELATGCKYELKSLTGEQEFGQPFELTVMAVASLQKKVSNPPTCAKTATVGANIIVGESAFEKPYIAGLT